jgi:ubiquinone/menaquinone biosynthesis C-methylase UbiE
MIKVAGLVAATASIGGAFLYYAFGAFLPWREDREALRLAEAAGVRAGQTVAEIGAGGGRFTVSLGERVGPAGRVYATELTQDALAGIAARASAAGLGNVVVVQGDRRETHLPDGCCDLVVLRNVYHHVTEPTPYARALRRAVRDGGRLAVIDFDTGALWLHGGRPDDTSARRAGHGVSRQDAIRELTAAGFQLEKEEASWSGPMWLLIFTAPRPSPLARDSSAAAPRRR